MSLLLDALKRAEEAKKAQDQADDALSTSSGDEPLSLTPLDEQSSEESREQPPLMTRDRLPNISQSMSILPEDFSVPLQRETKSAENRKRSAGQPAKPAASEASLASAQADRNAARRLFEAKTPDYDPRRPFYITLGALCIFAIGAIGYFWYQLQPPHVAIHQAAPVRGAIAQESEARTPASTRAATSASFPAAVDTPPEAEWTSRNASAIGNADATPQSDFTAPQALAKHRTTSTVSAEAPARRDADRVTLLKSQSQGPSRVEQGYAAFEHGDLIVARTHYEAALAQDPLNRDALMGLAAIDMRGQHYANAQARYLKLLEIDPRDPYAHAGLIGLQGNNNPVATESRIKNLLAQQPDANVLYFTLGNQYATQGRWPEAQQAYFKAYTTDPSNPDYAFNLAVSLDHLRQSKLALEYYQKAVSLSTGQPATFLAPQAEARIRELNR